MFQFFSLFCCFQYSECLNKSCSSHLSEMRQDILSCMSTAPKTNKLQVADPYMNISRMMTQIPIMPKYSLLRTVIWFHHHSHCFSPRHTIQSSMVISGPLLPRAHQPFLGKPIWVMPQGQYLKTSLIGFMQKSTNLKEPGLPRLLSLQLPATGKDSDECVLQAVKKSTYLGLLLDNNWDDFSLVNLVHVWVKLLGSHLHTYTKCTER